MRKRKKGMLGFTVVFLFLVVLLTSGARAAKVEVTLWCMAFDPHINGFMNVIEEFGKRNLDIEVTLEPQPGQAEMASKMRAALAARKGAHAFTTPGTTIMEWTVPGSLQPLSPYVVGVEQVKKDFLPENYIQCHLNNQIWSVGIPDPPGDVGIIVNPKHLREAGLAKLTKFESIDQLLEYAKKLARYDSEGKLIRGGLSFQESNDPMFWWSYIADQGGRFWDNEKQWFNIQTLEATKSMEFFYDLFYKYKVDSVELPNSLDALVQNLSSMAFLWPEFLPFAESVYPELDFEFIMKPPLAKEKLPVFSHTDTWNVVVPAYVSGKEREATFEFLRYLISEEGQLLFLDANPGFSPLKNLVFTHRYYRTGKGAYLAPVIEAIKAGQYRYWGPFIDADIMLYDIMWPNMDAIFHKTISVKDGLAKMEKELNEQNQRTREKYPEAPKTIIYWESLPPGLELF